MKIHVALKIARQYEGEYVFVQALNGFIDRVNLNKFLSQYQFSPTEEIGGVGCLVETGVVEVEIGDIEEFYGQLRVASEVHAQAHPEQKFTWKNLRNLPIAQIIEGPFPSLGNPEILSWDERGEGKREGKGFVWVEQDNPLVTLDSETFVPTKYWGELRLAQAFNKGRYGPVSVEPPQEGDLRGKEDN